MSVPEVDVATLATEHAKGAVVIDVRQPAEYEEARVPGATLLPLDEVVERIDEVPESDTIYVICATGARSARAVEFFRARGIDAVNVAGGIRAWLDAGEPVATGSPS